MRGLQRAFGEKAVMKAGRETLLATTGLKTAGLLSTGVLTAGMLAVLPDIALASDAPRLSEPLSEPLVELAQTAQQYLFSIAPQPLSSALIEYSTVTDVQLFFDAGIAEGLQSPGVQGELAADQALQILLQGTSLVSRVSDNGTITLQQVELGPESGPVRLGTIQVTGERATRTLEETASSVRVFGEDDIERLAGSQDVSTVLARIPNVTTLGQNNNAPSFRGLDSTGPAGVSGAYIGGSRPRLTMQVDGRSRSPGELVFGKLSTWDTESVEVFRGPQSTTQGQNAIAGAIFINTNDPVYDWEAKAKLEGGTYETRRGALVVNAPIIDDQVAFRMAADVREHESFIRIRNAPVDTGVDADEDTYENIRAKLLVEPQALPDLSMKVTFTHADSQRPQTELVNHPIQSLVIDNNAFPVFRMTSNTLTLDADYALLDTLDLNNTFSYTRQDEARIVRTGQGGVDSDGIEFQLDSIANYENEEAGLKGLFGIGAERSYDTVKLDSSGLGFGISDVKGKLMSLGVFGEATWTPIDWLDLTAGGRYQYDYLTRFHENSNSLLEFDRQWKFEEWLPKVGLAVRPVKDLTVGATVQKGHNPGGVNFSTNPLSISFFNEESVWNYELYWRSTLLNDRLAWNGNVFFSRFTDQQRTALFGTNSSFTSNAEKAKSYGLETDASFAATDELTLFAGFGFLETEIEEFTRSTRGVASGNSFQYAPKFTANLAMEYEPVSNLVLGLEGKYSSGYFSDDSNTEATKVKQYFLANAKLSYGYENFTGYLSVTNLFDNLHRVIGGTTTNAVTDPREFLLGIEASF